jgi:hypothetical protein
VSSPEEARRLISAVPGSWFGIGVEIGVIWSTQE